MVPLVGPLVEAFGRVPVLGVGLMYFLVRGVLATCADRSMLPYFQEELRIGSGQDYQRMMTVPMLAWAAKPGIGLLSDAVPLLGYHKRWYMVLSACMGAAALLMLSIVPGTWSPVYAVAGYFGVNAAIATLDLLTEGTYAAMMRTKRETGSSLVSLAWGAGLTGTVLSMLTVGPLADAHATRLMLQIVSGACLVAAVPPAANWFLETRVRRTAIEHEAVPVLEPPPMPFTTQPTLNDAGGRPTEPGTTRQRSTPSSAEASPSPASLSTNASHPTSSVGSAASEDPRGNGSRLGRWVLTSVARWMLCRRRPGAPATAVDRHPIIAAYAVCVTFAALIAAISAIVFGPVVRAVVLLVLVACLVIASFEALPPTAARANLFMFAKECLYVQVPGALDYWYTASPECVPDGPNFSYTFYQTETGVITAIAGALGLWIFESCLSRRSYRAVFCITTAAKVGASLCDVILVERWNHRYLGLTDKQAYVWGDAVVYSAAAMLDFMPFVVLISRLCPPGLESVMYALLAGFMNFGLNLSRTSGEVLMWLFAIDTTTTPCNFEHLSLLIAVAHGVLPVLIFPLSQMLLPSGSMDAPLTGSTLEGNGPMKEEDTTEEMSNQQRITVDGEETELVAHRL